MPAPVVVVGAGLAGLHAAWRLAGAGIDVVVLEARDRVGGRTWSQALDDGTVIERGGEFIAPGDAVLRGLCAELGLELIPHGFPFDRRPTPEEPAPTTEEVAAAMAAARDVVAARAEDFPAAEALGDSRVARRIETSLTVPLAVASARRLLGDGEHGYDPAARVRGGNQSVAQEIARRLGDRVRLRAPVACVEHGEGGATVWCADGTTLEAAAVVVAVPLPLLRELDLRPALPAPAAAALDRTLFGDAAKLHVPLATPSRSGEMASPARTAAPSALWWCWTSAAHGREGAADDLVGAAPVLSCFAGGAEAIAAVGAGEGPDSWVAQALALRPDVVPAPSGAFVTHWGAEPYTRGSYSAPAIGFTPEDDAALVAPWGSVVLAGEHTAGAASASMNGAAASGARAATTILDLLRH